MQGAKARLSWQHSHRQFETACDPVNPCSSLVTVPQISNPTSAMLSFRINVRELWLHQPAIT